jgi:two-component system cell cycle sensor histidine kinase/response regulator CckA
MNVMTEFSAARDYGRDLRFQAMFEAAAIGIGICRLDGRILEANLALCGMLGYTQEELMGRHAGALDLGIPLGTSATVPSETGPARGNETAPDNCSADERLLGELLRGERGSFEIEKRYPRQDGSEFWGHLAVSVGRDARRQPSFLIAVLADAAERRRVEEHLREAEKMEIIGRLAGGIAHDFNNLLTGVLLYCDLMSAGLEGSGLEGGGCESVASSQNELKSELREHVAEVRRAGEQGAALTHQLLAIARKQAAEPRPILVNEVVTSTENLLRRLIGEQVELVVSVDSSLDSSTGLVLADPAQVRQILLNLVLNARDALPQGGKIRLSTRTGEFPVAESPDEGEPNSARRAVSVAVKDDGCGMDAETRARLFEPFFTTKNPGEGTGLGLATVQRIVSESGGTIAVESAPGRGTCIEVFFPAIGSSSTKPIPSRGV